MPVLEFVFLGSLAAVSAGLALAGRLLSVRTKMARVPRVAIADAQDGELTRILGTVRAYEDAPLIAPLSRRACVAWSIRIRAERPGGQSWEEVANHETIQAFYVEEGDALALVVGPEIRLDMVVDRRDTVHGLTQHLHDFLSAHEILVVDGLRYAIQEGVLEIGETVTVVGPGRWEADPSLRGAGYRDAGKLCRIEAPPGDHVFVSDDVALATDGVPTDDE